MTPVAVAMSIPANPQEHAFVPLLLGVPGNLLYFKEGTEVMLHFRCRERV